MKKRDEVVSINEENLQKALSAFGLSLNLLDQQLDESKNPFIIKEKGNDLNKGIDNDLDEGNEVGKVDVKNIFLKGLGIEETSIGALNQLPEVIKGFTEGLASLQKAQFSLDEYNKRLSKLENEPLGRKAAASSRALEKNFNGEELQKGGDGKAPKAVFSLSRNRKEILNLLESKAGMDNLEKGGGDRDYMNALMSYESSGAIPAAILKALNSEGILIQK